MLDIKLADKNKIVWIRNKTKIAHVIERIARLRWKYVRPIDRMDEENFAMAT